jgi:hypothetical protein
MLATNTPGAAAAAASVMALAALDRREITALLEWYGATLAEVASGEPIPGSYWGEAEAGLVGNIVYVRADTPAHSFLHELCHYVCMDAARRARLAADAGGDDDEECGVCYLQVLLAERLTGFGSARCLADMDAWGYSFREGSASAWFEGDAAYAREWLAAHMLIDARGTPTGYVRDATLGEQGASRDVSVV